MAGKKGASGGRRNEQAVQNGNAVGRPATKATITAGNPIRVAVKSPDGYEHIGTGATAIERSGTGRIVRVGLEDGSTIIITVY